MNPIPTIPTVSSQQMAQIDRLAIKKYHLPLLSMMENAGRSLARHVVSQVPKEKAGVLLFLVGKGHNGGGGLVAARHLHNWGYPIHIVFSTQMLRAKPTTLQQWKILHAMKVPYTLKPIDTEICMIIDALLGYNIQGNPRESTASLIRYANETGRQIVALDLPSGLDPNTGKAFNPCIRATSTLTLALPKTGIMVEQARPYVGDLYLADIGIPKEVYKEITRQDPSFLQAEVTKILRKKHP